MHLRRALGLTFFAVLLATPAFAVERWILIAGSTTGVPPFRTDARILNPSFDKDISIAATFYPLGGAAPLTATLTVPKRQMRILNDVTTELFSTTNLGGIRFTSDDEFEVTSRIFATTSAGTLGQFGPGQALGAARRRGALLQLRSTGSPFRTNIGVVNPNEVEANVTFILYTRTNGIVTGNTLKLAPRAVIGPTNMAGPLFFDVGSNDISDAWVSFSSDQPVFAYASVVDSGTTDQTFVAAVDDVGVPPVQQQPTQPTSQAFTVRLVDFAISITPQMTGLRIGDKVDLTIINDGGLHGFQLAGALGENLVPNTGLVPQNSIGIKRSFTIASEGTHFYFCTQTTCGDGHGNMAGEFLVGREQEPGPGRGY
jgi:hypothetical protein